MNLLSASGVLLVFMAVADIFLTVLYPKQAGVLSPLITKGGWAFFRFTSRFLGRLRRLYLSLAGPILLLSITLTWSLLLAVGFALIFLPHLGEALQKTQGATPTGFPAALYYSGFTLTTLGIGDIAPTAVQTRLLTILEAGLGFSFFTLTITFIVSVYSALQRRNTLASILDHKTAGSGDALVLVADLVSVSEDSRTGQDLQEVALRIADLLESHKFYPILHYFHFLQNRYALPRMALIIMDTIILLESLPFSGRANLQPAITQLDNAGRNLLDHLMTTFRPKYPSDANPPQADRIEEWRRHFRRAVQTLRARGIDLPQEVGAEEEQYIRLRREWHPKISAFIVSLGYKYEEVLPNG